MMLVLGKMSIKKFMRICFLKRIISYCCWCTTCNAQHGSGKAVARYSYRTSAEEQRVSVLRRAAAPRWREIWCNSSSPGYSLTCSTPCIKCGGQCSLSHRLRAALIFHNSQGQISVIVGTPILKLCLKGTWRNTVCLTKHSFGAGTPPTIVVTAWGRSVPTLPCEPGGTSVPRHWLV